MYSFKINSTELFTDNINNHFNQNLIAALIIKNKVSLNSYFKINTHNILCFLNVSVDTFRFQRRFLWISFSVFLF